MEVPWQIVPSHHGDSRQHLLGTPRRGILRVGPCGFHLRPVELSNSHQFDVPSGKHLACLGGWRNRQNINDHRPRGDWTQRLTTEAR